MSNSLNLFQGIGNLGRDPEIKVINSESKVANFSIGCSESYKNKAGEKVETTEWLNIVCWNNLATIVEKYVKKGDKVYVSGKVTTRSYDAQDGTKKYVTEIKADQLIMLGGKKEPQGITEPFMAGQQQAKQPVHETEAAISQRTDAGSYPSGTPDDLPF